MKHSCQLVGDMAFQAIIYYSQISGRPDAPEGFIRDRTAETYHQATSCKVAIELPMRIFINEWGVDPAHLQGLGAFRVDMAAFTSGNDPTARDLDVLIEFKRWTDRNAAAKDIRRLKQMIRAINLLKDKDVRHIGGYVVVCPQYPQGMKLLSGALDDFSQRFPICYQKSAVTMSDNGKPYGVGVAVIDVHKCVEGQYG